MSYQRQALVKELIGRVYAAYPGVRSALKRARLDRPPVEFYQLTAQLLDEAEVHRSGAWRESEELLLLVVARAIVLANGIDKKGGLLVLGNGGSLGTALQKANYSEQRLLQLLNASGASLRKQVNMALGFLSAKSVSYGLDDIVGLLASDDGPVGADAARDSVRRRVARDYYRIQEAGSKKEDK